MLSVRLRTCAVGSALAVTAGVLADHGGRLGADLPELALFGVAAGAILALAPGRGTALRAAGFVVGLIAAYLGYALRAGVLPDIPMGRALAVVGVLSVLTAVATASAGRIPLWTGLLGAATFAGAYQTSYAASPSAFGSEATTAATTVLLAASIGYLVTLLVEGATATPGGAGEHALPSGGEGFAPADAESTSVLPAPRVADASTPSETAR